MSVPRVLADYKAIEFDSKLKITGKNLSITPETWFAEKKLIKGVLRND